MLGATIGKSNGVRSSDNTTSISSLGSIEVSLGVVISNTVLVGVGFVSISWFSISSGLVVSRSWGINWGSMDNGGMVDNWGMVNNWGSVDSMGNWVGNKSMVSNWVGNNTMVSNWMGNKSMVGHWVCNKAMVGNWVSYNTMVSGMTAMRDNSTMSMADHMG